MSLDRVDVQHAAKKMCTKVANPTKGSWKRLKKAAQVTEKSGRSDVGDAGLETRRDEG